MEIRDTFGERAEQDTYRSNICKSEVFYWLVVRSEAREILSVVTSGNWRWYW